MRFPNSPHLWQGKDGAGIASYGNIYVIGREVFVDDLPLSDYLSQFSGRVGTFEFVFPEDAHEYDIDDKILPLVKAVQSRGVRTLASCEGHLPEGRFGKYSPKPYVSFMGELPMVPEGWTVEETPHGTRRLAVPFEPKDAAELAKAQELIPIAVKALGG